MRGLCHFRLCAAGAHFGVGAGEVYGGEPGGDGGVGGAVGEGAEDVVGVHGVVEGDACEDVVEGIMTGGRSIACGRRRMGMGVELGVGHAFEVGDVGSAVGGRFGEDVVEAVAVAAGDDGFVPLVEVEGAGWRDFGRRRCGAPVMAPNQGLMRASMVARWAM